MALVLEIMKTIATPIGELALWLEETYQINIDEVIGKWKELTGMNITVKENVFSHDEVDSEESVTMVRKVKKIPKIKTKDTCQHTFLSGQKAGEQCTTKPKNGAAFCSAHKPKDSVTSVKDNTKIKDNTKSKKKVVKKQSKKSAKDEEEEEEIAKPLLKKKEKKEKAGPSKAGPSEGKKSYNTDEEHIDKDLNLSDEDD